MSEPLDGAPTPPAAPGAPAPCDLPLVELMRYHMAGDRGITLMHLLDLQAWDAFHDPSETRPERWRFYRKLGPMDEKIIAEFQANNPGRHPDLVQEDVLRMIDAHGF